MSLISKVAEAKENLVLAQRRLMASRSRRKILCSCGESHPINQLELIVTHWYVEPSGCSGGDYWNEGEWQFLCPGFGMRNRLMFDDYDVDYDSRNDSLVAAEPAFKAIYRSLFSSRSDSYDHGNIAGDFYNNRYVDEHRKLFELPPKKKETK